MTTNIPIYSGGGLRVRWNQFAGMRDWMDCEEVSIAGDFVVINNGWTMTVVPRHRIFGQLEIEPRPREGTTDGG